MPKRRTVRGAKIAKPSFEDDIRRVREEIVRAWADENDPGPISPCLHCPGLAPYFSARTWREVKYDGALAAALDGEWSWPLHYLPLRALRHFLAAYLLMYLDEGRLDVLADSIVDSLCPHDGWRETQRPALEGLGLGQKQAVLSFLRLVQRQRSTWADVAGGIAFLERDIAREQARATT